MPIKNHDNIQPAVNPKHITVLRSTKNIVKDGVVVGRETVFAKNVSIDPRDLLD